MIRIGMPVGDHFGWGVCGKYITRELAGLVGGAVELWTPDLVPEAVGDERELSDLRRLAAHPPASAGEAFSLYEPGARATPAAVDGPLLLCIGDKQLLPIYAARGSRTIGYTFFEDNLLSPEWIENGRRHYDCVVTGSSWCTGLLKQHGLVGAETVLQGVDPGVFFPMEKEDRPGDRFVVFSGGKFELRKGQDVVIRAIRVLQERHKDVVLVNAWYNGSQSSFDTMRSSPHLRWPALPPRHVEAVNLLLSHNGLDLSRVTTLGALPNARMPAIYRDSDVGLFPNRCEGGTNLVLMEYLACGKPVIATAGTGHSDVVAPAHALIVGAPTEITLAERGAPFARWPEPDQDDVIEKLEWAYQNRDALRAMGARGAKAMARLTWTETARRFLRLLAD